MKAEYRFPAAHVAALRELLAVLDAGGAPTPEHLLLLRRITGTADRIEAEAVAQTRADVDARRLFLAEGVAELPEDDVVRMAVVSMEAAIAEAVVGADVIRSAAIPDNAEDPFSAAAIIEVDKGAIGG